MTPEKKQVVMNKIQKILDDDRCVLIPVITLVAGQVISGLDLVEKPSEIVKAKSPILTPQ